MSITLNGSVVSGMLLDSHSISSSRGPEKVADRSQTSQEWSLDVWVLTTLLCCICRAMLCKRGLCRHAVSGCPSVTFVNFVKTSNRIFKKFSQSDSHTIIVFFYTKRHGHIPTGTPLTRASNAGGVGRNRDSEPISGSITCCEPFERQVRYTQLRRTMAS